MFREIPATEEKSTAVNTPSLHVVLDIDGNLATVLEYGEEKTYASSSWFKRFVENKTFVHATAPHLLHPGIFEFIQFLFKIPNVRVSFFSSGPADRNELLVRELLMRALALDAASYEQFKKNITILSANDICKVTDGFIRTEKTLYKCSEAQYRKNLEKLTKEQSSMEGTVLVEDDPTYIYPGQQPYSLIRPKLNYLDSFRKRLDNWRFYANGLFYVVGILQTVLEQGRESFTKNLFQLQYELKDGVFYFRREQLFTNPGLYLKGLAELRKINPSLKFYGGEKTFQFMSSLPRSESVSCVVTQDAKIESKSEAFVKPTVAKQSMFAFSVAKFFPHEDRETILKLMNLVHQEFYSEEDIRTFWYKNYLAKNIASDLFVQAIKDDILSLKTLFSFKAMFSVNILTSEGGIKTLRAQLHYKTKPNLLDLTQQYEGSYDDKILKQMKETILLFAPLYSLLKP